MIQDTEQYRILRSWRFPIASLIYNSFTFIIIENERFIFIRLNLGKLRVEKYFPLKETQDDENLETLYHRLSHKRLEYT